MILAKARTISTPGGPPGQKWLLRRVLMAGPERKLADLRRGIDEIDTAIHDLLIRRSGLVEDIAQAKSGEGAILRPGRASCLP